MQRRSRADPPKEEARNSSGGRTRRPPSCRRFTARLARSSRRTTAPSDSRRRCRPTSNRAAAERADRHASRRLRIDGRGIPEAGGRPCANVPARLPSCPGHRDRVQVASAGARDHSVPCLYSVPAHGLRHALGCLAAAEQVRATIREDSQQWSMPEICGICSLAISSETGGSRLRKRKTDDVGNRNCTMPHAPKYALEDFRSLLCRIAAH